ncbi:MAG: hypothetical protein ACLU4J_01890 [Butyricimonas paravirosa]
MYYEYTMWKITTDDEKKNIYDDASLIKKSLIKDLSDKEQKELINCWMTNPYKMYTKLSDRGYLKSNLWEYESILPKSLS